MIIDHRRLKDAIIHLANKRQEEYPDNRYLLSQAQVGGIGWTIDIRLKTDIVMDVQRLPPPIVKLDELADKYDTSLEDIVINTENVMLCLVVADNFVRTLDNLADRVRLFRVRRGEDSWGFIYFAKNLEADDVVITLQINSNGVIASSEVETYPANKP